jgi:hypothetical protein
MRNLRVFIFQQHWFHLGSLLEATIANHESYESITFYKVNRNLFVKPLDRHQDFFGSKLFNSPPESVMTDFLATYLYDRKKNFAYTDVKLSKEIQSNNLLDGLLDIKDLQKHQWDGTALGMAVSSFLISLTKDSNPKLETYRKLISNLESTYFQIYNYLSSLGLNNVEDEIWICNGRPFHERTVVEYARKNSIPIKYYEIGGEGSNQERWILHNNSPHDRISHQDSIKEYFNDSDPNLGLIHEWFQSQLPGGENVFAKKFKSYTEIESLDNYFVYFSSSDDEVSAISLDWNSSWENQLNAVNALIKYFATKPELKLVIRVHPNQDNKSKYDKNKWKALVSDSSNVFIYNYDSNIDSYQLLSKAKGVITYGSTIGVEAAFLKKPSALLARSRWDCIIPHQYLKNEVDIANWIHKVSVDKGPDDVEIENCYLGSLMWGHYMKTAGNRWRIIKIIKSFGNVNVGYLEGKRLKPPILVIAITRLIRFLRLILIEKRISVNKLNRLYR